MSFWKMGTLHLLLFYYQCPKYDDFVKEHYLVRQLQCVYIESSCCSTNIVRLHSWATSVIIGVVKSSLKFPPHTIIYTGYLYTWRRARKLVQQTDCMKRPWLDGYISLAQIHKYLHRQGGVPKHCLMCPPNQKWKEKNCLRQCISSKNQEDPQSHDPDPEVCVFVRQLLWKPLSPLLLFSSCGLDLQASSIYLSLLTDLLYRPQAMFSSLTNFTTASFLKSVGLIPQWPLINTR